MEVYEYLECVTEGIASNARARQVRTELHCHMSFLVESRLGAGDSPEEALRNSMRMLGDPEDLARAFAEAERPARRTRGALTLQAIGLTLIFLGASISLSWPPAILAALAGGLAYTGARSPSEDWRHPFRGVALLWRRLPLVALSAAFAGFFVGSSPIWAAGTYSPWQIPPLPLVTAIVLALALAGFAVVRQLLRSARDTLATAGVGGVTFAVASTASSVALWRAYPAAPSPYVHWFVFQGMPWFLQTVVARPVHLTAVWVLGTLAFGALVSLGRMWFKAGDMQSPQPE